MKENNYSMFETFHYFIIKIKKKAFKRKDQFAVISSLNVVYNNKKNIFLCYLKYFYFCFLIFKANFNSK